MTTNILNCAYDLGHNGQGQMNFILCGIKCKCGYLGWQAQYLDHKKVLVICTPRSTRKKGVGIWAKKPYTFDLDRSLKGQFDNLCTEYEAILSKIQEEFVL